MSRSLLILLVICLPLSLLADDTIKASDFNLQEVEVLQRQPTTVKSRYTAFDTEKLTGQQLCTAACCNLSESFENSASVDVAYSDAATGAKQIRLLGLSGMYVQMLSENTPGVRGLAQSFGMEYIPGPWMSSIQVSKGTSSVINGYEALTGQINVEYLKPQMADRFTLNAMLDRDLHAELNATAAMDIDDKCSTGLFVHARGNGLEMDDNEDGFMDMPKSYHLNLMNRWYISTGDYTGQVLVRGLYDRRIGGQTLRSSALVSEPYSIDLRTRRIDGFVKNGYVFDHSLNRSIGIIAAASYHSQDHLYGSNLWSASQTNAYLNAIFQTNFENPEIDPEDNHEHKLSAGLSVNYDNYDETVFSLDLSRDEVTPGIFAEYTYMFREMLTLLVGVRADWSSRYGFFATPRMNIRYSPFEWWTLRASVGLGYRSPNVIADNAAFLASSRVWNMPDGVAQERDLNAGVTTSFYIPIANRELRITGEYYHTRFLDGIIADLDCSPNAVHFYNISENPQLAYFAHVAQLEANMEILRGWTMTLAFRYTDTEQTSYNPAQGEFQLREKPLQNRFKGIISTSYQTPLKKWQFDFTAQFNGPGRMPDGFVYDPGSSQYFTREGNVYHRWYPQLMAQVTKYFRTCSIYLGSENMTNYVQNTPISGSTIGSGSFIDPYSSSFDASQVWAPIHGWKLYLGFRWNISRPDEE